MPAIFGAPARAHFYSTLKQPAAAAWQAGPCCRHRLQRRSTLRRKAGTSSTAACATTVRRTSSCSVWIALACGTPLFHSDEDAWQHVVHQARAGSIPHQRALQMVDPVERLAIEAKCGWCPGL